MLARVLVFARKENVGVVGLVSGLTLHVQSHSGRVPSDTDAHSAVSVVQYLQCHCLRDREVSNGVQSRGHAPGETVAGPYSGHKWVMAVL